MEAEPTEPVKQGWNGCQEGTGCGEACSTVRRGPRPHTTNGTTHTNLQATETGRIKSHTSHQYHSARSSARQTVTSNDT